MQAASGPIALPNPVEAEGSLVARHPTGLEELDHRVGGLSPGELWVITSAPGQGRSTLLTQLAVQAAVRLGLTTWLVSPRDDALLLSARTHSQVGLVSMDHLQSASLTEADRQRLAVARRTLVSSPLGVVAGPHAQDIVWQELEAVKAARPEVVLFDDPDWGSDLELERARRLADSGCAVVLALPRQVVLPGPAYDCDLEPTMRWADLVIEVRHNNLGMVDRQLRDEPGLAAIAVLRNRRGAYGAFSVAFQGHYARFVDES